MLYHFGYRGQGNISHMGAESIHDLYIMHGHFVGISHAFCTFSMLGDREPRLTWVSGLLHVEYIRATFPYQTITDLMQAKTIVAMVTLPEAH